MAQNVQWIDLVIRNDKINLLSDFQLARTVWQVQLSEVEIRQLCVATREIIFLRPNILEIKAPIKIYGKKNDNLISLMYSNFKYYWFCCDFSRKEGIW